MSPWLLANNYVSEELSITVRRMIWIFIYKTMRNILSKILNS